VLGGCKAGAVPPLPPLAPSPFPSTPTVTILIVTVVWLFSLIGGVAQPKRRWLWFGPAVGSVPAIAAGVYAMNWAHSVVTAAPDPPRNLAAWERLQDSLPLVVPLEEAIAFSVVCTVLLPCFLLGNWLHPAAPTEEGHCADRRGGTPCERPGYLIRSGSPELTTVRAAKLTASGSPELTTGRWPEVLSRVA
jgi:hypothetical protein